MATAIGLFFANVFKRFYSVLSTGGLSYEAPEAAKPMDVVVGIFPSNFFAPFVEANMLQIIVASLIIGFALLLVKQQKEIIQKVAKEVFAEYGVEVEFEIGTMIEIPRAALTADRIATEAQYFSFGTNDLTQMTFGYSRDDIASFLPVYLDKKILKVDPFQVLDQKGVGKLIKYAVKEGRAVRPDLRCGICGEHGGEPSSVKFCAKIGMNYASCSPFRVPIARLAAAQAAVEE